jgi:hypothetical protein
MKFTTPTRIIGITFVLLITMALYGAARERKVSLKGDWKFTLGDNAKFADPGYNDSGWENIYVPSPWQSEGFRHYNGYAWYRTKVEFSFDPTELLYLELGRVDDVDQVFINGHLIGSTGGFPPNYFTAYNVPRAYLIPHEYLVKGKENVIAVRVYDEGGEGGILGSNVGIYHYATYNESGLSLCGNWKFHLFDNKDWSKENFNDADWEDIVAPATWESQGFQGYDGFAWYRKKFTLPAGFQTKDLVVLLGKIDDMDQVFVNGEKIGETGDIESQRARDDEWQHERTYFIPDNLLHPGKENVIAVRVYDQTGEGGIFEGPLTIIPRTNYKQFWRDYHGSNDYFGWKSFLDWN